MKGKFYFETRCGKKHPKWIKLLEQYFRFITSKSNESFTWITLCAEMNEELLAIKKRTVLNEKPISLQRFAKMKMSTQLQLKETK